MNPNKNKLFINIRNILTNWGFSKKGLILNSKGEWYFISQILLILLHFIPSYPKVENIPSLINNLLQIIGLTISSKGLIISIQALKDLGKNLTPLPYPMNDSNLIKNNSYKKTRHPIYKGLLFISLGVCIFSSSLINLFLFFLLVETLRRKALKEEERLKIKFPEYEKYIKEVPAIISKIKYLDWRL